MTLKINDNVSLAAIQQAFSAHFPFLRIEFFSQGGKGVSKGHKVATGSLIGEIRELHRSGSLSVQNWYTAGYIERQFRIHYGLIVRVYRKNEENWEVIRETDMLTLKEHNETGRASCERKHEQDPAPDDFQDDEY